MTVRYFSYPIIYRDFPYNVNWTYPVRCRKCNEWDKGSIIYMVTDAGKETVIGPYCRLCFWYLVANLKAKGGEFVYEKDMLS